MIFKKPIGYMLALSLLVVPISKTYASLDMNLNPDINLEEKIEDNELTDQEFVESLLSGSKADNEKKVDEYTDLQKDEGGKEENPQDKKDEEDQKSEGIEAQVSEISKYGNITLSILPQVLYDNGFELGDIVNIKIGDNTLTMPFATSYGDVDTSNLVMIDSSDDEGNHYLIIAINMGNFAQTYNVDIDDPIFISLNEKKGYLDEYEIRQLNRTYDIADYNNDPVVYANFRPITTTGIKEGIIYRSSNPINNEINRAKYANMLAEESGIKTVLNLADTSEDIESYVLKDDFDSKYYYDLFKDGKVITLSMGVDVTGDDFGEKLSRALRFLAANEGPYLVHCTEGKDRAGFVSTVISALMGASLDEIINDYMITYENYYHVERESEKWYKIAESNIIASVTTVISNLPKGSDISNRDLAKDTKDYLKRIGLNDDEIVAIKSRLSGDTVIVSDEDKNQDKVEIKTTKVKKEMTQNKNTTTKTPSKEKEKVSVVNKKKSNPTTGIESMVPILFTLTSSGLGLMFINKKIRK